jgi:hypothetical protein
VASWNFQLIKSITVLVKKKSIRGKLKEWNCSYTMLPIYQYYYKIYLNLILIRIRGKLKEYNCTYTMLPIYQYYYKIYLNLILIRIHINLKKLASILN